MMKTQPARDQRGITLIELLVVVVIAGALLTLLTPQVDRIIKLQRLRGINAQVVTDLQFARAEAAARNDFARFAFNRNAQVTCYTLYTSASDGFTCDCRLGEGNACTQAGTREIKTVTVPRNSGVVLSIASPPNNSIWRFAFDSVTGGIWNIPTDQGKARMDYFTVNASLAVGLLPDPTRMLSAHVNNSGRTGKCSPSGSTIQEVAC